jgi:hypothetical protein
MVHQLLHFYQSLPKYQKERENWTKKRHAIAVPFCSSETLKQTHAGQQIGALEILSLNMELQEYKTIIMIGNELHKMYTKREKT